MIYFDCISPNYNEPTSKPSFSSSLYYSTSWFNIVIPSFPVFADISHTYYNNIRICRSCKIGHMKTDYGCPFEQK